jgi:hypothetical protein
MPIGVRLQMIVNSLLCDIVSIRCSQYHTWVYKACRHIHLGVWWYSVFTLDVYFIRHAKLTGLLGIPKLYGRMLFIVKLLNCRSLVIWLSGLFLRARIQCGTPSWTRVSVYTGHSCPALWDETHCSRDKNSLVPLVFLSFLIYWFIMFPLEFR